MSLEVGISDLCGNCILDREVKAGRMTADRMSRTLRDWSEVSMNGPEAPSGVSFATIDSRGTGSCSASHRQLIEFALFFIRSNIGQIPSTCHRNTNRRGRHKSCFDGHSFSNSPRTVIRETLDNNSINFVIHCARVCSRNQAAYTVNGQWRQNRQDIHICESFLDEVDVSPFDLQRGIYTISGLACVIVHEIYHVWGADEHAARRMQPSGWACP